MTPALLAEYVWTVGGSLLGLAVIAAILWVFFCIFTGIGEGD